MATPENTPPGMGRRDILDQLVGVRSPVVDAARQTRPVVVAALQGSYQALVDAAPGTDPTAAERAAIGLRVAAVHRSAHLTTWFTEILEDLDADRALIHAASAPAPRTAPTAGEASGAGRAAGGDPRTEVLLGFAGALAADPAAVGPDALAALRAVGLDDRGIVIVGQLIAYLSYVCRVTAGLAATVPHTPDVTDPAGDHELPGGFSIGARKWTSHLRPVSDEEATAEQWAALTPDGTPTQSEYLRTLARDPASLVQRALLYDETMYGEGGLGRADRELVALAVSMINGCAYCASVHSRRLAQLTKARAEVIALLDGDPAFVATPRRRLLVRAAAELTAIPSRFGAATLAELRRAGLDDAEIFDVINVAAIFAWANRLMLVLGTSAPVEPVRPAAQGAR